MNSYLPAHMQFDLSRCTQWASLSAVTNFSVVMVMATAARAAGLTRSARLQTEGPTYYYVN